MSVQQQQERYEFGVREKHGIFGGIRASQFLEMAIGGIGGLAVLIAVHTFVAAVLCFFLVILGLGVALAPIGSRTMDQWLPVVARHNWRRVVNRHRHVSLAHLEGYTLGTQHVSKYLLKRQHIPPTLRGIEIMDCAVRNAYHLGVVWDRREKTLTAAIGVEGERFALLDEAEQAAACRDWVQIPEGIGLADGPVARVAWYERQIPDDGSALRRDLDERSRIWKEHPAWASYDNLIRWSGPASSNHISLLALQIDLRQPKARRLAHKVNKRDLIAGGTALLTKEIDQMARKLAQNRHVSIRQGPLTPAGMAMAIRSSYQPEVWRLRNILSRNGGRSEIGPDDAWPRHSMDRWDRYWADGMWHCTFWVREWPRQEVGPAFLAPLLLLTDCVRTVALVMDPQPPLKATREHDWAVSGDETGQRLREKWGFRTKVRQARASEAVQRREQELADGHVVVNYSAYVTVSAPSEEWLDEAIHEVKTKAAQSRLELERLDFQHEASFTYSLPLCRGLKRQRFG